jgi:thymidylate kinase
MLFEKDSPIRIDASKEIKDVTKDVRKHIGKEILLN